MKFRLEPAPRTRVRPAAACPPAPTPDGTVFAVTRPAPTPGAPQGPVVVATLTDLDVVSEHLARAELRAVCRDTEAGTVVVVRLGSHHFVDVRGLDVLLDAAHAAARDGRRLVVVDPPHTVLRMLDVLDILDLRAGPVGLVPPAEDELSSRLLERSTS